MLPSFGGLKGKFLGKAFDIPKQLHDETFYAAVTLKVRLVLLEMVPFHSLTISFQNAEMKFNFGDVPFEHVPLVS